MTTIKQCIGYFRPRAPSPNVHPKGQGHLWAWVVRSEERECLTARTANWGRRAPVLRLLANDGPKSIPALGRGRCNPADMVGGGMRGGCNDDNLQRDNDDEDNMMDDR